MKIRPTLALPVTLTIALGCMGCADAAKDSVSSGAADAASDAFVPPACLLQSSSSLPHVHIVSKAPTCVFTLAEARAGISIPYDVVIDEDVPGFTPIHAYAYGANVSGLAVSELLQGGAERYCLCDQGLPYSSCPLDDGGVTHDGCPPTTLKKGTYPRTFTWDGVNWTGPSDTQNPKGPPFPPGDYTLTIETAPGKLGSDAGTAGLTASAKLLVRLVR